MRSMGSLKDPSFLHADSKDSEDSQAELSLPWAHSHFAGFVMSRLIFLMRKHWAFSYRENSILLSLYCLEWQGSLIILMEATFGLL